MRQYLNNDDFLSQILMFNEPVIIVEGSNDVNLFDSLFNLSRTNTEHITITSPELILEDDNSKGNIISTLIKLDQICEIKKSLRNKKTIGIVDSDFNQICGHCINLPNLFYIDKHDIDAQIFSSNAFAKLISLFYYDSKNINLQKVREKCVEIAKEFGYYLLSLYENKLYALMRKLRPIYQYFDEELKLQTPKIWKKIDEFLSKGDITRNQLESIKKGIQDRKNQDIDEYHIANGHDLVKVLTMLTLWNSYNLKKKRMSQKHIENLMKNPTNLEKELEEVLRTAYEYIYFQESNLFRKIIEFQRTTGISFIKEP